MLKIFLLLLSCGFCWARTSSDLRVRIDDGRIVGRYWTTESGRVIRAFMGIPYAEPPVGKMRFRAPLKPKPWSGILLAQQEPPMCTQTDPFTRSKKVQGQEDCLYLNVYAPEKRNDSSKVPVMVWLHGGGWMTGHGGASFYSPDYLLEHDIVLVTGNYRLGPLGFMSYENKECSGNFGLKDQALLLQWVRMNVDKFGGDSGSVTIFGESAGGASVNYHMISPMSKGLFDRGISQSGTLMNTWADPPRPGAAKMRAIRITDIMGCPIANTNYAKMIECMRGVDAKKITAAVEKFYEWDVDPVIPFPPVVENTYQSEEEPFISDYRFKKHSFDIPWLAGLTSDEGLLKTAAFFNNKKLMDDMIKNWDRLLPITFEYDHLYEPEQQKITEQLNGFYFNNEPFAEENRDNLTKLWSDGWLSGILHNLEYRLKDNLRDNTYLYYFSHKGSASFSEVLLGGKEKFYGTCHADDLLYLFPMQKTMLHGSMPSKEDKEVTRLMTKLWVNFAASGNPTPEWSSSSEFPFWTPVKNPPFDHMVIGNKNGESDKLLRMEKGLMEERVAFWKRLKGEAEKWWTLETDADFGGRVDDEL